MPPPIKDITGQKFGELTVIERCARNDVRRYAVWRCRCSCGVEVDVSGGLLRAGLKTRCNVNGHSLSNRAGTASVRGDERYREYRSWCRMRERCHNPRNKGYASYGGRGITVCDRWSDFEAFYADMGPRPSLRHSIDRIDVNGNYEPENCRWATATEQSRNCRDTIYVEDGGKRVPLADVAEQNGINLSVLYGRLKMGWSLEKALTTPKRKSVKRLNLHPSTHCMECGGMLAIIGRVHRCNPASVAAVKTAIASQKKRLEGARALGRPPRGNESETLTATRPWNIEGQSRTTWYRRRAEQRGKE